MVTQLPPNDTKSNPTPLKTKAQYIEGNPAITKGGLNWLIFHQRADLIRERAIANFGRKILINEENLNRYILNGGTRHIGGCQNAAK